MMRSELVAAAEQAAATPFDPAAFEADTAERQTRSVYSARIPAELSPEIAAAAAAAKVTPSQMIATLVGEALQTRRLRAAAAGQTPIVIDLAALHLAIDTVARPAAA